MFGFLAIFAVACQNAEAPAEETETSETENTETEASTDQSGDQSFGETITKEGAVPYAKLVNEINEGDSIQTKVVGTVEAVCQAKGCWMDIVTGTEGDPSMHVKFKDYGFFVPKDISGRQVVMEGYAYREVTSVEDLRHYAEDEGLSQEEIEKITEPREDIKFMASGVIVLDETAE
ncbi:MAG: DUF4920 domain-containing protein [Bacteroidetes bacterium]|nr:DUF4920 domain-containing protein [Bacteroidota bacterium]